MSGKIGSGREESVRPIVKATVHEKFNKHVGSRYYDVNVLKFHMLVYSQTVRPTCLLKERVSISKAGQPSLPNNLR